MWIGNSATSGYQTRLCNSVGMTSNNLRQMTDDFDGLFGGITDYSETIASVKVFPLSLRYTARGRLSTSFLDSGDTKCYELDDNTLYYLGSYFVDGINNDFTDLNGYSSLTLYLPFVGFVDIDINDCYKKFIIFDLNIDYQTGKGMIIISKTDSITTPRNTWDVISTYVADISIDIPVGSSNFMDNVRNLTMSAIKTTVSAGASLYTGSLPPPTTTKTTNTTQTRTYNVKGASLKKGSRMKQTKGGNVTTNTTKTETTTRDVPVDKLKPISDVVISSASALASLYKNGSCGDRTSNAALDWILGSNVWVIRRTAKVHKRDSEYLRLFGAPLGESKLLSELANTGYTEISSIHFEGEGFETATTKEIKMLDDIFGGGLIF